MTGEALFSSFFMGGFECSTHKRQSGQRVDVIAATDHDRFAAADYARLREQGIRTARDGVRWHLVESQPGRYDFSSVLPMIRAARETGVEIIWDLCHFGWPDNIDILSSEFVRRFAAFARAFTTLLSNETDSVPFVVPINEISFWSWAGGDKGFFNPFLTGHGFELKAQLVRASIEAIEAVWSASPHARIVQTEPVIHIAAEHDRPQDRPEAEAYTLAQYQAWDMLAGRLWPHLGGSEKYLDVIGVNYYPKNQWVHNSRALTPGDDLYRPFAEILCEVYSRYRRPVFVSETGTENDQRPAWLTHVSSQVRKAMRMGVPVEGICLYPIVNHPGWEDNRHCHNGLWDYADGAGQRSAFAPLANELRCQRGLTEQALRLRWAGDHSHQDALIPMVTCLPDITLIQDGLT